MGGSQFGLDSQSMLHAQLLDVSVARRILSSVTS